MGESQRIHSRRISGRSAKLSCLPKAGEKSAENHPQNGTITHQRFEKHRHP